MAGSAPKNHNILHTLKTGRDWPVKPTNYLRAFVAEYFDAGCGPRDHMLLEANELV
jgi:hypothetical protein